MTPDDIETAIGQRLAAAIEVPIAWPNRDAQPARPFVMVQFVTVDWTDPTMDGSFIYARGYMTATVVAELDRFSKHANGIAAQIMAAFPKGLVLQAGSGRVAILKPATPTVAFRDMQDWRQPVRVDYEAETTTD